MENESKSFINVKTATLIILFLAAIIVAFSVHNRIDIELIQHWVQQSGAAGWLAFVALYAVATTFLLPASLFTVSGGLLFGPWLGTFLSATGATAGAFLSFLIARHFAHDWVRQKLGNRMQQIMHGIDAEGWRFVAMIRLIPVFPFFVVNYSLGITNIGLAGYTISTWVFIIPAAALYTIVGYAGGQMLTQNSSASTALWIALLLTFTALIVFLPRLIRQIRHPQTAGQDGNSQ